MDLNWGSSRLGPLSTLDAMLCLHKERAECYEGHHGEHLEDLFFQRVYP